MSERMMREFLEKHVKGGDPHVEGEELLDKFAHVRDAYEAGKFTMSRPSDVRHIDELITIIQPQLKNKTSVKKFVGQRRPMLEALRPIIEFARDDYGAKHPNRVARGGTVFDSWSVFLADLDDALSLY